MRDKPLIALGFFPRHSVDREMNTQKAFVRV